MRIKQTSDRLILRDSILVVWCVCLVFVIAGIWIFAHYLNAWRSGQVETLSFAISAFLETIFFAVGIFCFGIFPATSFVLNRARRIVIVRVTGLLGRRTSEFRFDEVREFVLTEMSDNDGGTLWRAEMKLKDGRQVPLSSGYDASLQMWQNVRTTANEFLETGRL